MRTYIIKILIAAITVYILFELTLGPKINYYSHKLNSITDVQNRIEIKEKILIEMKKATAKENYFSKDEQVIISNFLNKIIKELKVMPK
jgi:cell division FtsZ-interacting protein ZapD